MGAEVVDGRHPFDELAGVWVLDPDDDRFGAGGGHRDPPAAAPWPASPVSVVDADWSGEEHVDVVGSVADGGGFGVPPGVQRFTVEGVLAGACRQRCGVGGGRAGLAEPFEFVLDLVSTLGEQGEDPLGDAGHFAVPAGVEGPVDAQAGGELVTHGGVVDGTGGPAGAVDRLAVQRRPAAVGPASHVGDQHVGVELRVAGPAGAVPEPGGDEPAAGQATGAEPGRGAAVCGPVVRPATHEAGLSFQPADRFVDRRVEGFDDLTTHQRVAQRVQHRHRLRRRERQVEPRHPPLPGLQAVTVRCLAGARIQPSEDRPQVLTRHRARQPQGPDGVADPPSGQLAAARVVVVEPFGDLAQVVRLGSDSQLPHRQHPDRTSTPADPKTREKVAAGDVVQHLGAWV